MEIDQLKKKLGAMKIEHVPIDKIKLNPRNPRKNEESVDDVVKSMTEFGGVWPILVRRKNKQVIAGNTRLKAYQKLGLKTVPVIYHAMSEVDAEVYGIFDNKSSENTPWDNPMLADMFVQLDEMKVDLDLTGFSVEEIEDIRTEVHGPREGLTDDDQVPEPPKKPITKLGDLWLLGEHRVLCGDATKAEDVGRLMGGVKADMVFTDPPYNVAYGDSSNPRYTAHVSGKHGTIKNDKQSDSEWLEFNKKLAIILKEYCKGDFYVWGAPGPDGMRQRLMFIDNGIHWSAVIIWKKQRLVLAAGKYQRMYEPCFYGWHKKSSFVADRKQVEVWEVDRPHASELHPTMKPVELCCKGIGNSSNQGGIVWDGFLGSGSTLIACEKLQRKCYGLEIEPKYVDVIVKRWQDYTGLKAERST